MRDVASCDILAVWKRAALRNRMRENFTSGSVGGLVEQSPALPGLAAAVMLLCGEVSAGEPAVGFESGPGRLVISIGGRPLATYFYADQVTTRPYFAHVHAPTGVQVTRNHPPKPSDLQDHATLHPGIWLAFGG